MLSYRIDHLMFYSEFSVWKHYILFAFKQHFCNNSYFYKCAKVYFFITRVFSRVKVFKVTPRWLRRNLNEIFSK